MKKEMKQVKEKTILDFKDEWIDSNKFLELLNDGLKNDKKYLSGSIVNFGNIIFEFREIDSQWIVLFAGKIVTLGNKTIFEAADKIYNKDWEVIIQVASIVNQILKEESNA